jgi:coproporphyrinogen III oxidase
MCATYFWNAHRHEARGIGVCSLITVKLLTNRYGETGSTLYPKWGIVSWSLCVIVKKEKIYPTLNKEHGKRRGRYVG